ncbi:MAG TPA: hypothetical protein VNR00_15230 [Opitutus sp.]|nr:hypothetical protein [Opitutus sp.]
MKTRNQCARWRSVFVLGILLGAGAPVIAATPRQDVLEAIQAVENPTNTDRPGPRGELGPYQFRVSTWRMHSTSPFRHALETDAAHDVAVRHYEWIRRGLIRNGLEPSCYNIALAWNSGLSAVVRGRAPAVARDYAQRVTNLVKDRERTRLATAE